MIHLIDDNALIRLLTSNDHVERFQGEYYFIERKLDRLDRLLYKWKNHELDFEPKTPRTILEMQAEQMRRYLETLDVRAKLEGITFSDMDGRVNDLVYRPEMSI